MNTTANLSSQLCFKAFLSHRYKSSDVNLYFFNLFSKIAEVQFEVDKGNAPTCVTKLERMIRDSEAFIGVYPFPGTMEESQHLDVLRKESRYFRLEIDLAIRAQKPAIIFYDRRYGTMLRVPPGIMKCAFDTREIGGAGGSPRAQVYEAEFARFCQRVMAFKHHQTTEHERGQGKVGVFVPHGTSSAAYQTEHLDAILAVLDKHGCDEVEIIPWPFALDHKMLSTIDAIEWAVVDIGAESGATGIPAFLHGRFIPTVRLRSDPSESVFERSLTVAQEVGYQKDIVRWNSVDMLTDELNKRVISLLFERQPEIRRFSVTNEAESYFRSAALFKENVFVSYAGKNRDTAFGIADAFKRRFQDVFNYRDGESIRPGQPWLPEIFSRLATSAIGIPLLSADYFDSGNCIHEAQEMIARRDNGKMQVIPIKISDDTLDMPSWLGALQYERLSTFQSPDDVVRRVVNLVGLAG